MHTHTHTHIHTHTHTHTHAHSYTHTHTHTHTQNGRGKVVVLGSAHMFHDHYIDKEENSKLQDVIFRWLTSDDITLNAIDAEDPEVRVYTCTIPRVHMDITPWSFQVLNCRKLLGCSQLLITSVIPVRVYSRNRGGSGSTAYPLVAGAPVNFQTDTLC